MSSSTDLSQAQVAFKVRESDVDDLLVLNYQGTESLCRLFSFEIDLVSRDHQLTLNDVVGRPATLSINDPRGERWFHGMISRFTLIGQGTDLAHVYRAELVPQLWLLTQRYDCRIFQNKSTPEIIAEVLREAGFSDSHLQVMLKREYEQREYCVQYRETDYNFISRLMEEDGIWWNFEHDAEGHRLVIADSPVAYSPIRGEQQVPFAEYSGLTPATGREEEHVSEFRLGRAVRPSAMTLTDFNFRKPGLLLDSQHAESGPAGLQVADHPGGYVTQQRGVELARQRLEELRTYHVLGAGRGNCRRMQTGKTFTLTDHPAAESNGEYLVTTVVHSGRQFIEGCFQGNGIGRGFGWPADRDMRTTPHHLLHGGRAVFNPSFEPPENGAHGPDKAGSGMSDEANGASYACTFECIPAEVVYRPTRTTRRPIVHGTQTARVVGPQNEEIYTDEQGRIKVQFHWDRIGGFDENSSCWIRVSQGMAGGQYGMMFLPRIGQEVVVDFLEGNPDRPLVVGRVFNADHMPPYPLPEQKTRSVIKTNSTTKGHGTNEIRFEDLADKEQLFIQAQRRMDTRVKAGHYHTVGGSYHLHVGGENKGQLHGEYRQTIYKGKHVHVKGEQRAWIEEDDSVVIGGNQAMELQGARSAAVAGHVLDHFELSHKHEVGTTYHLDAGKIKLVAPGGIELTCGGSSIVLSPAGVHVEGPLINIANGPGPTVPPAELIVTGPAMIEDASTADSSEPGRDCRYSRTPVSDDPAVIDPQVPGHEFDDNPDEPDEDSSWLDIELVDQHGKPVPHEPYRVIDSREREIRGTLDRHGYAHVTGVTRGPCQITFPRRDFSVWKRADGIPEP